ncbi:sugar transporter [Marinilabiliaceae bacterium JC017]|nr:sugar transporter [Marinilabiliaceae bacterium JC017]
MQKDKSFVEKCIQILSNGPQRGVYGLFFILFVLLLNGCIPQRETVYLQNLEHEKNYENTNGELTGITDAYHLQPNDYLFVHVNTPDPKLSEFFNSNRSGTGGGNQQNQNFFYHLIDDEMNIDFPYVGKINLKGCNIPKAKEVIREALKPFLKEVNLTVKLANNTYTILGEIRQAGVKKMKKDQVTIFEAIAEAGDITSYGKRKQIKLMRQTPQGPVTYMIDLTDKNIVNSACYYIYPNDMIYIRPMKAKNWGVGESFSIGVISSLLALGLTFYTLFK